MTYHVVDRGSGILGILELDEGETAMLLALVIERYLDIDYFPERKESCVQRLVIHFLGEPACSKKYFNFRVACSRQLLFVLDRSSQESTNHNGMKISLTDVNRPLLYLAHAHTFSIDR